MFSLVIFKVLSRDVSVKPVAFSSHGAYIKDIYAQFIYLYGLSVIALCQIIYCLSLTDIQGSMCGFI